MRVVGCGRVSTGDQELSLDAQRHRLERECEARDWELVEYVEDQQGRGKTGPGLASALERLARHDADVLMVAKLDRLPRSVASVSGLMERAQREGWMLVMLDPAVDMSTPYGRAMGQMAAVFAELERELIGARTRDALAELKASGRRLGRPNSLTEGERAHVRELAAVNGYQSTARILNAEGVRPGCGGRQWWASSVRSVVRAG